VELIPPAAIRTSEVIEGILVGLVLCVRDKSMICMRTSLSQSFPSVLLRVTHGASRVYRELGHQITGCLTTRFVNYIMPIRVVVT